MTTIGLVGLCELLVQVVLCSRPVMANIGPQWGVYKLGGATPSEAIGFVKSTPPTIGESNMKSNGNRRKRDTAPTVETAVPNTQGNYLLVYRGVDSQGNVSFHWKIARRNRSGDGYYQTFRLEGVWDVIFGLHYLCSKMALVPECSMCDELKDLAQRLGSMIAERAVGKSANGEARSNAQQTNGLATAFGPA